MEPHGSAATFSAEERGDTIVKVLADTFGELMADDPAAFRKKFRKMAASPFAFYRGSACLFYTDVESLEDPFLDERTSRVWIHGDLHAENYGTYMAADGVLVFNVNDFDEAYVGPFTWDLRRVVASLALVGHAKAFSDDTITGLVRTFVDTYLASMELLAREGDTSTGLTIDTTTGVVHRVLQQARLLTRVGMLDRLTLVEGYDRRFAIRDGVRRVAGEERAEVEEAFRVYLATLPGRASATRVSFRIKDVVARTGVGIGSAGLPSYNLLVEGPTQALENDVVVYMKQGQEPALSRFVVDERVRAFFQHEGHRTVVSQRALQAHADPWLGYTTLRGIGQLVAETSPYASDLDWSEVTDAPEAEEVTRHLARATARMHSVADDASGTGLIDYSTEQAILARVGTDRDGFTRMLVDFAHAYAARTRADHQLFVDLFRNGRIPGI
jgi:uncharacterized protein (DUF2252 family)